MLHSTAVSRIHPLALVGLFVSKKVIVYNIARVRFRPPAASFASFCFSSSFVSAGITVAHHRHGLVLLSVVCLRNMAQLYGFPKLYRRLMESNRAVSGFNSARYVTVRDMTMRLFRLPGELDKIGSGAPVPPGLLLCNCVATRISLKVRIFSPT